MLTMQEERRVEESDTVDARTLVTFLTFGALGLTGLVLLGVCGLFALCRRSSDSGGGRRRSNNSIVREQSMSIVRGEHPIAFMLPTVSLSEAGSETDPTPSDLESLGYQSSSSPHPPSPSTSLSLASLTGSNIYSTSLLTPPLANPSRRLLQQQHQGRRIGGGGGASPVVRRPRSLQARQPGSISAHRPFSLTTLPGVTPSASPGRSPRSPPPTAAALGRLSSSPRSPISSPTPADTDSDQPEEGGVGLEEEGEEGEGGGRRAAGGVLGRIGFRLTYRPAGQQLQVRILRCESLPTNYRTATATTSVKLSILPTKLPKHSTQIVAECLNPEFNEEFTFLLDREGLLGKVLKLTVFDHDSGNKKTIGSAVVSLSDIGFTGTRDLEVRESWKNLRERVESELSDLLADRLQVSLRYEPDPGRLSLGVLTAWLQSLPHEDREADIYVKVTLYEGRRVIKAKKTRQLSASADLHFQEKFSILLPANFLDAVSCVISLCARTRFGTKQVLGRTSVGPYAYCSGTGLSQWQAMVREPGQEIVDIHSLL